MNWLEQYRTWQLRSRVRYVVTEFGLSLLMVLGLLWIIGGTHPGEAPLRYAVVVVLGILVYGWVYYPRAKAKSRQTSDPTPTAPS